MKNIKCLDCKHFRMWDGDPCCLEPKFGWKLILPDLTKDCDYFFKKDNECVSWDLVWESEKENFFKSYDLKCDLYDKYIKEHPEYEGKIKKNE